MKFNYIRSPKLLKACRSVACQHCGRDDGTVCAAHSNQARHGKGRGLKASDIYVASLCFACHYGLDQGAKMTREEREKMWADAHLLTVKTLVRLGKWPAGVPFPDCLELIGQTA
jgi:hypothetical protein